MTAIQCLSRRRIKKKNLKIRKENDTGHAEWGALANGKRGIAETMGLWNHQKRKLNSKKKDDNQTLGHR